MSGLTTSFRWNDADVAAVLGEPQRRAAGFRDALDGLGEGGGLLDLAARRLAHEAADRVDRALADGLAPHVDARQAGGGRERDEGRPVPRRLGDGQCVLLARQHRIERPSAVSSASEASTAIWAVSVSVTPGTATNSDAMRLPKVIVPVLSRSSVSTSPDASTALPDMASTLWRIRRSMPAMPIADRRPPIVVGMRVTRSATRIGTETAAPA